MQHTDKRFGLILFSSIVVMSVAKVFHPSGWNRLLRGPFKSVESVDESMNEPNGQLIIASSEEFHSGAWKTAYTCAKVLKDTSKEVDTDCELEITNDFHQQVLLCWINTEGTLLHYHPINDKSIKDSSVRNVHIEFTQCAHSFVCIRQSDPLPAQLRDVAPENFVFHYTPTRAQVRHCLTISRRKKRNLRSTPEQVAEGDICVDRTIVTYAECRGDLIDTNCKVYLNRDIAGFRIRYEEGVFEDVTGLEEALCADVNQLRSLIPEGACDKLCSDTAIWVNKSITFGTTKQPVRGRCATFHPLGGADWLCKNGMNIEKEGCIEIYEAESYMRSRHHWGLGGIMLHEFSHAYHNKCIQDGFDCNEIRQAYNQAMKLCLYDSVPVHGPQGERGNAKAYACTNCMEFFAELSVAYFWSKDANTEFNKWFPYNRSQLLHHDFDSFAVIDKFWRQYDTDTIKGGPTHSTGESAGETDEDADDEKVKNM